MTFDREKLHRQITSKLMDREQRDKLREWVDGDLHVLEPHVSQWLFARRPTSLVTKRCARVGLGLYRHGGVLYAVVQSRGQDFRRYGKRLDEQTGEVEYAPGVIYRLNPQDAVDIEEIRELSEQHSLCAVCLDGEGLHERCEQRVVFPL